MKLSTTSQRPDLFDRNGWYRTALFAGLVIGTSTSIARAQDEPSSADTAAARELAIEGLKLADAGHCAQAIDKLYRAENYDTRRLCSAGSANVKLKKEK